LQDYVTYRMFPTSINASDYFYVNFDNGDVYVRRDLSQSPLNTYNVRTTTKSFLLSLE